MMIGVGQSRIERLDLRIEIHHLFGRRRIRIERLICVDRPVVTVECALQGIPGIEDAGKVEIERDLLAGDVGSLGCRKWCAVEPIKKYPRSDKGEPEFFCIFVLKIDVDRSIAPN